ncbi:MAG: tetratricopeptide repeat protein [Desulfuromonadaceae bacterium]|nr:tetratricopeptide repeat protein [Desulfuromonadaceae bacterium]
MAVDYDILYKKIAECTELLATNRQSPVFVDLCEAYRQLGMLEDAASVARQGLALVPQSVPGLVSLGRVLAQQGDLSGAVDVFSNAVAIDGTAMPALTGLARVLVMQGNTLRAREVIQRAAQINPHDSTVKKILSALGNAAMPPPSATPAPPPPAEPATEGHLDPIATLTIAELYERQGLVERALKVYRDLLHKEPENELLRSKVARLQDCQSTVSGGTENAEKPDNAPGQEASPSQVTTPIPEINGVYLATLNRWLDAIQQRRAHV